jgi:hypothetical protein
MDETKRRTRLTEKVTARIEAGQLVFYHNHEPVGKLDLASYRWEMAEGWELDGHDIYSVDSETSEAEAESYARKL